MGHLEKSGLKGLNEKMSASPQAWTKSMKNHFHWIWRMSLMSNKKTRVFMPSARKTNKNIRHKSDKMSSSSSTRGEYTFHLV